ncbi:MAG: Anti-sigma-K factor RskA/Anti-sigma-K factor RskA [Verrucomicrobia bacterium]|nr:MAG: Anti-sigma-K factor RskA/Anti-sigma-K factor RskA [Verrucomicrobiota bacterium]
MIDETYEELASLYVLGLLEGAELASFEQKLARDPALTQLVRELSESSAQLAFTASDAAPSPELRARLLDRLDTAAAWRKQSNVLPFRTPVWLPWAAAASLAISCAWLGQLYLGSRFEAATLRDQQALADFELRSARNQLEAERLIAGHQLSAMTEQLAALDRQLKSEGDLAQFKISTLASLLGNSPQALAVAVWNPAKQEGVLTVDKLPALADDKDYQLWLVDPQYPIPVDGGVFRVDPATGVAHVTFKANRPVNSVAKFAVSLERKGGVPKAEGPMVLLSQ